MVSIVHFEHCTADLHLACLVFPDRSEPLTARELALLRCLSSRHAPIPKARLATEALGTTPSSRTLTGAIRRLRVRLEPNPADPIHLLTVFGVGYQLTPARPLNTNLPPEPDLFCGRKALLRELMAAPPRLRTLVGCGGLGKTRFARRLGAATLCRFPGGVWFVDLSSAADADGLQIALRRAMPAASPKTAPGALIAERGQTLVILDNAEQIREPLRARVRTWMAQAPFARFLVTSRRPLGLEAEVVTELPPLPHSDARQLFCDRAGQGAAEGLDDLLEALDGHPLSIELMAARSPLLSPAAMLARLTDQSRLSALPRRGVPDHQRTLRTTMAWSWGLLSPQEQGAMAALSTFRGGFSAQAASAVLGRPSEALLATLQAHSLLHRAAPGRWSMFSLIRAFSDEQLSEDRRSDVERRHGAFFAEGSTDADLDNLLVATRRALARADDSVAARAGRAALALLASRGPLGEAMSLSTALLAAPLDAPDRLAVLLLRARFSLDAGDAAAARASLQDAAPLSNDTGQRAALALAWGALEQGLGNTAKAHAHLQEALSGFAALGDALRCGEAHAALAGLEGDRGALALAEEHAATAAATFRAHGAQRRLASTLTGAAYRDAQAGRVERADERFAQALQIYRQLGDTMAATYTIAKRANLRVQRGDLDAAAADYEEVLARYRKLGHRRFEAAELGNSARVYRLRGDHDAARARNQRALALHRQLGDQRSAGIVLNSLGSLALLDGDLCAAQEHFEQALACQRATEDATTEGITLGNLALVFERQGRPEAARRCYRDALNQHRQSSSRANEGITLGNLGDLERGAGRTDEARALLEEAIAILTPLRHPARGAFAGALAEVLAGQGDQHAADTLFDEGEQILAAIPSELGLLRCRRAAAAIQRGDRSAARAALDAARQCASPSPGRLSLRISDLQRALEGAG